MRGSLEKEANQYLLRGSFYILDYKSSALAEVTSYDLCGVQISALFFSFREVYPYAYSQNSLPLPLIPKHVLPKTLDNAHEHVCSLWMIIFTFKQREQPDTDVPYWGRIYFYILASELS